MDQAGVDKVLAQSRHELDSKTVSAPRGLGVLWEWEVAGGERIRTLSREQLEGLWRRKEAF